MKHVQFFEEFGYIHVYKICATFTMCHKSQKWCKALKPCLIKFTNHESISAEIMYRNGLLNCIVINLYFHLACLNDEIF